MRARFLLTNFAALFILCVATHAQTPEFTYQGRLVDGSLAASGTYEMRFRLFDADGTQQPQPTPITLDFTVANGNAVVVSNGIFTVRLNFTDAAFPGAARFLEISLRRTASDPFTPLNPRQPITSAPHNIRSLSSGSSDGLSVACVLCVTDAQIQSLDGSKVTGTVANATTATNVSGIVPIANGGTGSSTKNFVDLSTSQNIFGMKTFQSAAVTGTAVFNGTTTFNNPDPVTLNGSLNVGGTVNADQFYGGADGLTGIQSYNLADNAITTAKIANGSVTEEKLAVDVVNPSARTLTNLGTLRWDLLREQRNIHLSFQPFGIAFDGQNMWVTEFNGSRLLKIRASDGTIVGTFNVGSNLRSVAFDGSNLWITSTLPGSTLLKVRTSDGAVLGTFTTPQPASDVIFDGENVWVANGNAVSKFRTADGMNLGTFPAGSSPQKMTFDGAYVWISNGGMVGSVTKLRALDGTNQGSFPITSGGGAVFDGNNTWIVNQSTGNLVKIRTLDGANLGTFSLPFGAFHLAFDGVNLWALNNDFTLATATKVRPSDGVALASYSTGANPSAIAFDGMNMWVTNLGSSSVTRLPPAFQK